MPTGMPGRSYTSYEVYRDYNSDDLLDEMYPPIDGSYTPQLDGGRYTPLNGLQNNGCHTPSPGRPSSRMRTPGRPQSRLDVSVQLPDDIYSMTESKRRNLPETTRSYVADNVMRPTSPVQRMLDRCQTQPYMSLQGPLPGSDMDPFTKQYYQRQWQGQTPTTEVSLNRHGRAGGVWRHVRACTANTGSQLAFIDGTVKQEDNVFFPSFRKNNPRVLMPGYPSLMTGSYSLKPKTPQRPAYRNKFNNHAKEGFKYWYQEQKPIDSKQMARRRILRQRVKTPSL